MPELVIDLAKLKHNIHVVKNFCEAQGLELIGIVKGCFAFLSIIKTFQENGIKTLGLSRVFDGVDSSPHLDNRPMLIALSLPKESNTVTQYFKTSLNSEITTIQALAKSADRNDIDHEVLLMVDNGDLREGVMPEDVLDTVRKILEIKNSHLKFGGLGANLGCCSGTLPDEKNLLLLHELAIEIEKKLGCEVKTVSVGGSIILDWMEQHDLPFKINQIRVGEAILLGYNTNVHKKHKDLFDDVLTFRGQILEVKEKPSVPPGIQGCDAFGKTPQFEDRGIRKRAILNFGIVDTEPAGITPRMKNVEIINSNSNYTIIDVTNCDQKIEIGDILEFNVNYSAMIRIFLSPHTMVRTVRLSA